MTDQIPPLDLPPDENENQETTPHSAQRTAPMRPTSLPEQLEANSAVTQPMTPQAAPTTPNRTQAVPSPVPSPTPPQTGTQAMPPVSAPTGQGTRPMPPVPPQGQGTRAMPPVAPRPGTQAMPAVPPQPRPGTPMPPRRSVPPPTMYQRRGNAPALTPRDSSFYLPWWSLALMLVGVLVFSFLIVLGIALLGGSANPTNRDPIIVIVTAPPTAPAQTSSGGAAPAGSQILMGQNPPSSLDLQGPTLPAVQFTATPITLEIGKLVIVSGVDGDELNVRDQPGTIETNILGRVPEGTLLTVVDGPRQADGFTWWQVQSMDQTIKGWAVSNFLQVASEGV